MGTDIENYVCISDILHVNPIRYLRKIFGTKSLFGISDLGSDTVPTFKSVPISDNPISGVKFVSLKYWNVSCAGSYHIHLALTWKRTWIVKDSNGRISDIG